MAYLHVVQTASLIRDISLEQSVPADRKAQRRAVAQCLLVDSWVIGRGILCVQAFASTSREQSSPSGPLTQYRGLNLAYACLSASHSKLLCHRLKRSFLHVLFVSGFMFFKTDVAQPFTFLNELMFTSGASFWWQCKHKQTTGSV